MPSANLLMARKKIHKLNLLISVTYNIYGNYIKRIDKIISPIFTIINGEK